MFGSSGENVTIGGGKSLFVPKGYRICTGCKGKKTKSLGFNCMTCSGQGYVRN